MARSSRHDKLTPAARLLSGGLGRIAGDLGRVVGSWPAIVGPQLARVSTPSALRDGTLRIRCASASWAQTINGNELQLLERLERELGAGVVSRINARAGGPAPRLEPEPPAEVLPDLDGAQTARLEQLVASVDDPDLRARLLAAATATARRRAMRPNR
jgi:hypothetical protein